MMKIAVIFVVFLAFADSQSNSCPHPEDIRPCVCRIGTDKYPSVTCENIQSSDELRKVIKNMGSLSANTFELHNSNIGILPADIFNGIQIRSLYIMESNLTRLSGDRNHPPFLGLENSLDVLEIKASFGNNTPLTLLSLSHLKKLTSIQLDGNVIPSIGNNWFESGPYGIRDLYLRNASLSTLASHAFEALEDLQYFALTIGSLSDIKRSMFPMPSQYLQSIDLSGNKIQSLPEDIFTKMPSLEEVFLEQNALSSISEKVFAPVWSQLDYIYFHSNPIKCDQDLRWVYKYRLPEHFAGYCDSPAKLRHKDFRNITLSDLE